MRGHGAKFGRKKEEAIAALLTHRSIEDAARAVGIDPNTLLRWLKVPEFQKAYREARRQAFGQAISRLQYASGPAVTTLQRLTVDTNVPPAVRARAAYYILTLSKQSIEIDDIDARVAELERAAEDAKASGRR
jgi:transposase-like protein